DPERKAGGAKKETEKREPEKKEPEKKEPEKKDAARPGVVVRYTYRNSPADGAGIQPGDRIVSIAGKTVADREALREAVSALSVGQKAAVEVLRGDERLKLEVALAAQPEGVPDKLPAA